MEGNRNKEIKEGGFNLSKREKLEVCLARKLMSHIDTCSHEELLKMAKMFLGEIIEVRLFEETLKNPS